MDLLDTLNAEREIQQLIAVYCQHADDYALDAWAALFTDDGGLRIGDQWVAGHAALHAWLAAIQGSGARMRHLALNPVVRVESAQAALASVDMLILRQVDGAWVPRAAPRYRDRFVKTAAGWRFAERVVEMR